MLCLVAWLVWLALVCSVVVVMLWWFVSLEKDWLYERLAVLERKELKQRSLADDAAAAYVES